MNGPRLPEPPPSPPGAGLDPVAASGPAPAAAAPSPPVAPEVHARPALHPLQPSGSSRVVHDESDEALAGRAARGDSKAFEILLDRYQRVIFNLTLRMTGNWQDARELTQDVFVKTWRGLQGFDTRRRFFSWLYRIAIHACLNHRRKAGRDVELDLEIESQMGGPDRDVEVLELERNVHGALARLSAGDRQLLVLRHFLDLGHEEIAEVVGVPAARVKSRLFEARQRLRRELERQGVRP